MKGSREQKWRQVSFVAKLLSDLQPFWWGANGKSADLLLGTKTNENLRLLHTTTRNLRVTIKNGQPMLFLSSMKKCLDLWILKTNKSPCLDSVLWLRTGYSFWDRLHNYLHKFPWIVLSVHKLNKIWKFW